jgi:hypothetical protein
VCFPLPGMPLSTSSHQIFIIRIRKSVMMQDQSQRKKAIIFILVQALSKSNSLMFSLVVLCYEI